MLSRVFSMPSRVFDGQSSFSHQVSLSSSCSTCGTGENREQCLWRTVFMENRKWSLHTLLWGWCRVFFCQDSACDRQCRAGCFSSPSPYHFIKGQTHHSIKGQTPMFLSLYGKEIARCRVGIAWTCWQSLHGMQAMSGLLTLATWPWGMYDIPGRS